jgi:hypothetical protein
LQVLLYVYWISGFCYQTIVYMPCLPKYKMNIPHSLKFSGKKKNLQRKF